MLGYHRNGEGFELPETAHDLSAPLAPLVVAVHECALACTRCRNGHSRFVQHGTEQTGCCLITQTIRRNTKLGRYRCEVCVCQAVNAPGSQNGVTRAPPVLWLCSPPYSPILFADPCALHAAAVSGFKFGQRVRVARQVTQGVHHYRTKCSPVATVQSVHARSL